MNIVSDQEKQKLRLNELENILIGKHYPKPLIKDAIRKAIESHKQPKKKIPFLKQRVIPFVTTYNPNNPNMYFRTKTLLNTGTNTRMREINSNFRLLNSKRQPPNLKKILTRARFSTSTENPGSSKCNTPRCGTCPLIVTDTSYTFNNKPLIPFKINSKLDCTSKNLIYVIFCPTCKKEYVGQTSDLRNRVTVHKQQIRDERLRKLPVSKHLHSCHPDPIIPFRICPIAKKDNRIAREILESHLIQKYKPKLNQTE